MNWLADTLDELASQPAIGYLQGGSVGTEPTAISALALVAHGRLAAARLATDALAAMQQPSGEVGVRSGEPTPGWPTSLAIVAWSAVQNALEAHERSYQAQIDRGVTWLVANRGRPIERSESFGHNTELVGWAYAEQTHSWVEPTAFAVLALKAAGKSEHAAAREAVAVLLDRQLPGGGLNYGNTYVLGQLIRPHVQPTGIALLALAGTADASPRTAKSIAWLRRSIGPSTTALSLGWALLGLRAQNALPDEADQWLAQAASTLRGPSTVPSHHRLALLALAAKGWPQ